MAIQKHGFNMEHYLTWIASRAFAMTLGDCGLCLCQEHSDVAIQKYGFNTEHYLTWIASLAFAMTLGDYGLYLNYLLITLTLLYLY